MKTIMSRVVPMRGPDSVGSTIALMLSLVCITPLQAEEGRLLIAPDVQQDSAEPSSDLQRAADAAAAKIAAKPSTFRLSLLDKTVEQTFPDIDCDDGSDLMYRWDLASPDQVSGKHIENHAAFAEWYKAKCLATRGP